jgi:hypothetical protein
VIWRPCKLVSVLVLAIASIGVAACDTDTGCKDDYDCPQAQICDTAKAACEDFVCKADTDCPSGEVCVDNACGAKP